MVGGFVDIKKTCGNITNFISKLEFYPRNLYL